MSEDLRKESFCVTSYLCINNNRGGVIELVEVEVPVIGLECNKCNFKGSLVVQGDFCTLFRQPKAEYARCVKCIVNELSETPQEGGFQQLITVDFEEATLFEMEEHMSLEAFEIFMEILINQKERESKFGELLGLFPDGQFVPVLAPVVTVACIMLLENYFGDTERMIFWWFNEGSDQAEACTWDRYGNEIPMVTVADLYNYLTRGREAA